MKYIKRFSKVSDYEAFKGGGEYVTPNISLIDDGKRVYSEKKVNNGGKIVNHGVITTLELSVRLTFEYPPASDFEVLCGNVLIACRPGQTVFESRIGPGESLGSTVSFYPSNEDNAYIYEVAIE